MKLMVKVGFLIFLATVLFAFVSYETKTQKLPILPGPAKVSVVQMPPVNGIVAVSIECPPLEDSQPNSIPKLNCSIKNNSGKNISAYVSSFTVLTDTDGIRDRSSKMLTAEMLIHPDYYEERKSSFVMPSQSSPIQFLPTAYEENTKVIEIILEVDYVEFADGSGIGPNRSGSKILREMRAGAKKFKDLLFTKYAAPTASSELLLADLETPINLSSNTGLSKDEIQGANILRKFLKRRYEEDGIETLKSLIKRGK